MTATDELRRMLDERGVEWTANDGANVKETCWSYMGEPTAAFAEYYDGTTRFACDIWCFTPEQAIAATLGARTCHDKGNIERFICSECGCRLDLQDDDWEATMWLADGAAMVPRYCPNCGRRCVG